MTLAYETYDRFVVERDVKRIERVYRARGFALAHVEAGRVHTRPDGKVDVQFVVDEGPETLLTAVRIETGGFLRPQAAKALAAAQTLAPGQRWDEQAYVDSKKKVIAALTDHGYAHATIRGGFLESELAPVGGNSRRLDPVADRDEIERAHQDGAETTPDGQPVRRFGVRIDAVANTAEIFLQVDPGPECTFDDVSLYVDGNAGTGDLPDAQIRRAIGIRKGQAYSTERLESARHALLELGVFSTVDFVTSLTADRPTTIPVRFNLQRAPLHTITLGGGVQADVLQTDTHFLAGYEHQNFLGGLRRLTMTARPGLVLFPTNLQNLLPPQHPFFQVKARAELRQPDFLEPRTRGTLRSEFLVYPLLLPARTQAEVPDVVLGYREIREAAGIDRTFFKGKLSLSSFYNIQLSFPFAYLGTFDQGLSSVTVSHLSFTQALDFRDDPIHPRKGVYLANEIQLAGGFLRGDADDVKVQPDLRLYAPISAGVTTAMRGSLGFLFPRSYGSTLSKEAPDPSLDPVGAVNFGRQRDRDLQLLFFRAFFSGGPSSNRGYPLRGVGPRGIAPFELGGGSRAIRECVGRVPGGAGPSGTAAGVAALPPVDPATLQALCYVPLGGLSLWEWSFEVRFQLTKALSTLIFLDASDVTRDRLSIRFNYPHLSTGSGLRYDTPVGPVRLDIGYAIPGLQRIGGTLDPLTEGQPSTVFGLPIAVNIAVGEAFLCHASGERRTTAPDGRPRRCSSPGRSWCRWWGTATTRLRGDSSRAGPRRSSGRSSSGRSSSKRSTIWAGRASSCAAPA
jgi:outer membrane protein insertion porin family/translocation and assembly module TamA